MESLPGTSSHQNGNATTNGRMNGSPFPTSTTTTTTTTPPPKPRNPPIQTTSTASSPAPPPSRDSDITSPASTTSISSPPYWVQSHHRSVSNISIASVGITLQDNTIPSADGGGYDKNGACWAKSVHIDDHVVVNGRGVGLGIGAFVVWNVSVETLRGGTIHIRKRYSEFDDLRDRLLTTFPLSEAAMPPLPPKGVISKFRPKFLEQRRTGLQFFLNCILLNPEFSGSPVLKDFIFA